jgi:predicted DNA-binding transcriptional regulator AlpA
MAYSGNPTLSALWLTDPAKAAAEVTAALRVAMTLNEAADTLGVGRKTLYRWLKTRRELAEVRRAPWVARELEQQ